MYQFYYELFLQLGIIIVFLGLMGILMNRLNILLSIICIEVMFYGLNFLLISISLDLQDMLGQIFSLFVLTAAASESALALALIMIFFRIYNEVLIESL